MPNANLPRLGILAFMDDEYRTALSGFGHELATEPQQILLTEGVDSRTLYVVLAGTFAVAVNTPAGTSTLDTVGPGDCLGEISLFEPGPASATATSTEKGKLWAIDSESLQRFLGEYPLAGCALVLGINTLLSRRLRKATSVIKVGEIVPTFLSVRSRNRSRA